MIYVYVSMNEGIGQWIIVETRREMWIELNRNSILRIFNCNYYWQRVPTYRRYLSFYYNFYMIRIVIIYNCMQRIDSSSSQLNADYTFLNNQTCTIVEIKSRVIFLRNKFQQYTNKIENLRKAIVSLSIERSLNFHFFSFHASTYVDSNAHIELYIHT